MAEDIDNDDQWLYGENEENSENAPQQDQSVEDNEENINNSSENNINEEPLVPPGEEPPPGVEDEPPQKPATEEEEEQFQQAADESDKEEEDEESDDDVNVVIGDIKTSPTYTPLNIKRGGLLTTTQPLDKSKQQPGKFTVEEFDQPGLINGVPATEFNLDTLEDKPWRKPGADITDYFNYGFNEDTWKAYCERQKRLRLNESGVGVAPLNAIGLPRGPVLSVINDNSKYSGNFLAARKAGPPPGRRMTGTIDVIVGSAQQRAAAAAAAVAPMAKPMEPPKENVIQVMTADRREYSRKPPGFPDMSVPPPSSFEEFQPDYGFNPEPEPYYGGYEPTQDVQWNESAPPGWAPSADVKSLTPGPVGPPPHMMGPPVSMPPPGSPPRRGESPHRERDRERDRESRSRSEKPRDRERERSHRRERSRSRSRRHKSKSRSPSHRSHRKKKSRRHEDSE